MVTAANPYAYTHSLNLSQAQMQKLLKGQPVTLKHGSLTGAVPVHLTKSQMSKIQKSHLTGKGTSFKMGQRQARLHGKGWFGDAFNFVKKAGRSAIEKVLPVASQFIKNQLIPRGQQYATNLWEQKLQPAVESRLEQAANRAAARVEQGADRALALADQGLSTVGLGLRGQGSMQGQGPISGILSQFGLGAVKKRGNRPRGRPRKAQLRGDGFFDSIGDVFKGAVNTAVPFVVNAGLKRVFGVGPQKRVRGGRKMLPGVAGGAPFSAGYRP